MHSCQQLFHCLLHVPDSFRQRLIARRLEENAEGRSRVLTRSTQDSNLEPPDINFITEMFFYRSQVRYPITPADPVDDRHQICCNQYGKCMKLEATEITDQHNGVFENEIFA